MITYNVIVVYGNVTHSTVFNSRPECSLNFRIRGKTAFCFPGCIVKSFWFPVCSTISGSQSVKKSRATYFAMVHICRAEINEPFDALLSYATGFQFYCKWNSEPHHNNRITRHNQPSSSFSRYLSRMGSSFTTCCVAEDRIDARCALNNLDWKYRFQNSASESC